VNRFIALYRLTGQEMVRLIELPDEVPSDDFVSLYFKFLSNEDLSKDLGALHLTLFDSVDDARYAHRYTALYKARKAIEKTIATRYESELEAMYRSHDKVVPLTAPMGLQPSAIRERQLKNRCLGLLATIDSPGVWRMIRAQIDGNGVATDRLTAFNLYLNTTAPDRLAVMESFGSESSSHPVSWEAWLAAVGGCSSPDVISLIRKAESLPAFQITQVNDHRALFGAFAANRKISLETPEGRDFFREVLMRLAPVNQNSTVSLLRAFGAVDQMDPAFHVPLVEMLVTVRENLDHGEFPVVRNTIRRLLLGAPMAVKTYETLHGRLPE